MRSFSILAMFAASPALAHGTGISHTHADWALPVGLGLIALAAGVARVRVRK